MNDWQYTFDSVSRAEWIRQIETDLRQKPLSSLSASWWPGEELSPVIHPEDISGEPIRLPDFMFAQAPALLEWIDTHDLDARLLNTRILDALRYDTEILVLSAPARPGKETEDWLSSVHREMIQIEAELDTRSIHDLESWHQSWPVDIQLRLNRQEWNDNLYILLTDRESPHESILQRCRFVYSFPNSGSWTDIASSVFERLSTDIQSWVASGRNASAFFNHCILILDADPFFFKHILQSRVLQLIQMNIMRHHGVEPDIKSCSRLESHIWPALNEDPSRYLIRASMSALATALCGTGAMCIHHGDSMPDSPEFFRRIDRNIHHLLNLESEMYKGTDPLAGAYALELYTRKWAGSIRAKIKM